MSRAKGDFAEERGCEYLVSIGFNIIERNFYSRFGEIDIIASKDDILHFVEVKSGEDYELCVQNITPLKLSRLIKTGDVYLKKRGLDISYCYDALLVMPTQIEFLENITL